jgi:cyclomaltodextrinase
VRLATLFQMTYPGAPSIYYGDEIGLRGTLAYDEPHLDRDARWPFPWDGRAGWDLELLEYFKGAIALRHAHPALRRGQFIQLFAAGDVFAFARRDEQETLIVALNVAAEPCEVSVPAGAYYPDGTSLRHVFGQGMARPVSDGRIAILLPPREGLVLSS